jgi:hypothetical protein
MSTFGFLAAPARRALASAGISAFADLERFSETELLALHGMGPNAVRKLKAEMALRGVKFADQ